MLAKNKKAKMFDYSNLYTKNMKECLKDIQIDCLYDLAGSALVLNNKMGIK
jgi:hypothetical protein